MSSSIHQTVSSATFLKSIQYHLCVGCHPQQQSGHLSLKQILLENKGHEGDGKKGDGYRGYRALFFFLFSFNPVLVQMLRVKVCSAILLTMSVTGLLSYCI